MTLFPPWGSPRGRQAITFPEKVGLNSGAKAAVQGFAKWEAKASTQARAYWWSSSASTQEISKSGAQAADDVVEVGCKNNWKRVTGTWIIGAVQTHSRLNKNSSLQLETYWFFFFLGNVELLTLESPSSRVPCAASIITAEIFDSWIKVT